MDVVAVRPDELTPTASTGPSPPSGGGGRWWLVAPYAVLAGLVALLILLVLHGQDVNSRDNTRRAVLDAARNEALALTSISYRSTDRDLDRIVAGATGQLARQFASERTLLPAALQRTKSTTTGTILSAGLVRLSMSRMTAQVAVAVDATVTTQVGGRPAQALKHYRMVLSLQRVSGRWLASDVAFAGAPQ